MGTVSLTPDTKRIRFSLGEAKIPLGLPTGKNIIVFAPNPPKCLTSGLWNGEKDPDKKNAEAERRYVPVTTPDTLGYMDLIVKVYKPGKAKMADGQEVTWADGGKVSQYLHSRKVGDFVELMGPFGQNEYLGRSIFKLPNQTVTARHVGMIVGGTGITPMLQILNVALKDPRDYTTFYLIYANKTEADIICRDRLEELQAASGGRLKLILTLDFPPSKWQHQKGFVTREMLRLHLPPPTAETLILVCGPQAMIETCCKKNLEALKYRKDRIVTL